MQALLVALGCALILLGFAQIIFPPLNAAIADVASATGRWFKRLPYSTFLQVGGLAVVSYGLGLQWPWVGVMVAGVGLVLVGVATEIEGRRRAREPD